MVWRLVVAGLAVAAGLAACAPAEDPDMHLNAKSMSSQEQKQIDDKRYDPQTREMLNSRPR